MTIIWIISSIDCSEWDKSNHFGIENDAQKNTEFIQHDIGPLTHMELGMDKRLRRQSAFDRGYDEFLRNYYNDEDIKRRGRYKVRESEESASDERSEPSNEDDDGDDRESESNESEENRKKYKPKPQKTNSKRPSKKPEKKSKQCKTEKRGNMLCNICYNPINDEKAESCSYNSDPKGRNYAYSEDTTYRNRDKNPESLEENSESDDEKEESTEENEKDVKKNQPPKLNAAKPPMNHKQPPPRFYPPFNGPRRYPNQNYGPQLFLPQAFQPLSVPSGGPRRPIRIHINNPAPPPPVAIIRYRTAESPFGSQHIRLITYPGNPPPQQYPPQYRSNRPAPYSNRRPASEEQRPPRDTKGAHSESFPSNVTKDQPYDNLRMPFSHSANREYASYTNKDSSKCKKSIENGKVCFECYVKGERRRECMFANINSPDNFYKSYSTSKKYSTNHPYAFDMPEPFVSKHIQYNTKSHSNKNKDYNAEPIDGFGGFSGFDASDERFGDLKLAKYEKLPNASNVWDFNHNNKQVRPQSQPLHSLSGEIIYGKPRPGPDPMALFFQMDPTIFNNIMGNVDDDENSNSKANNLTTSKTTNKDIKKSETKDSSKQSNKEINKATSKETNKVNNKKTSNRKSKK